MFSLISVWIKGWVNNHEAGDLRRHHGHHDVSVMNFIEIYPHESKYWQTANFGLNNSLVAHGLDYSALTS